ncbi:hypothetical protein [Microvirga mediterraneensis]|uniref:Uncharacterized protein n=1 Tax=Microvirga mediterraneensis TaxID=2754695 RepID=A0A838BM24_9HYPH|nr:hypothetical protein [Microvirga mediterraneensis]MBA1156724.1 hypothetical protein [Microvirga mediterraneensis]
MAIVYPMVALVGGLVSCVLLWPYGAAIALLSMPIAGSLLALAAAVLVYRRTADEAGTSHDRAGDRDPTRTLRTTESR